MPQQGHQLFISYTHADRPIADALAATLSSEGFNIWWDPELYLGQDFTKEIERTIERVAFVIVIWTKTSVKSDWVMREARLAAQQHKLLPISFDDCVVPLEFSRLQTKRFINWPTILAELYRAIGIEPELQHSLGLHAE